MCIDFPGSTVNAINRSRCKQSPKVMIIVSKPGVINDELGMVNK